MPGERIERDATVVHFISGGGRSTVTWSGLTDATADAAIAATIDRFARLGAGDWEWKHYSYDRPSDLPRRLLAAGFRDEPAEALMVAEIAGVARCLAACGSAAVCGHERAGSRRPCAGSRRSVRRGPLGSGPAPAGPAHAPAANRGGRRLPWRVTRRSALGAWSFTSAPSSPGSGVALSSAAGEGAASSPRWWPTARPWRQPGASGTCRFDASPECEPILRYLGFVELATTTPFIHLGRPG
jgi:hypothetical protein